MSGAIAAKDASNQNTMEAMNKSPEDDNLLHTLSVASETSTLFSSFTISAQYEE